MKTKPTILDQFINEVETRKALDAQFDAEAEAEGEAILQHRQLACRSKIKKGRNSLCKIG